MTKEGQIHWQKKQSFIDKYRHNFMYHLSSDIKDLGRMEIIPMQDIAGPMYYIMTIQPDGNLEPYTVATKDSHLELLPYIHSLYIIAIQETQSLKFSSGLRDTITSFLTQKNLGPIHS